jgi:hypothetical protein
MGPVLATLLAGCAGGPAKVGDDGTESVAGDTTVDTGASDETAESRDSERALPWDRDGDGTPDVDDCAPTDPDVHPGAEELCANGVDDDCDGTTNECPRIAGEYDIHDIAHWIEDEEGTWFGVRAAPVGDTNGDGYDDFVAAAPEPGGKAETGPGAAYLMRGGEVLPQHPSDAAAIFVATESFDPNRVEMVGAGDIDGDGLQDVAVAFTSWDVTHQGIAVWLFSGALTGEVPIAAAFGSIDNDDGADKYPGVRIGRVGGVDLTGGRRSVC